MKNKRALVTGAGGFIGSFLVAYLKRHGFWVRGVDVKRPEFGVSEADEFLIADLRREEGCLEATHGVTDVYALAADMGGMGFIASNHALIQRNNSLININTLEAARVNGVERLFFSSSACVYPESLQAETDVVPLKEEDAYPADPQDAYGWEKLTSERLCVHYQQDYGIETRVARFHNIYGPRGTWDGGREKAPAALCRKVALAKLTGSTKIEIWGDGEQTRSFCYIDDCVEGIYRIMQSDCSDPVNLGHDRMVSINELAELITDIAGVMLGRHYIHGPQGVRGRNSDNAKLTALLNWAPRVELEKGLDSTYRWIEKQIRDGGSNSRLRSSQYKIGS